MIANSKRYNPLKDRLTNNYLLGRDRAPQTVVEAKRLLADYTLPERSDGGNVKQEDDNAGVAFTKARLEYKNNVQCYGCGKKGYLLYECT